jgi:molybdopterin-guanine dinucleotide biosynthesis protein A
LPETRAISAVVLAGGKSSRMGCDKAGVIVDGVALWQRQVATLRCLAPEELFISGREDGPYAGAGVEIVPDITPGRGPLSGLEAALLRAMQEFVLVLAIDLPAMTSEFLSLLVSKAAASGLGLVPRLNGWFEPLAALYPKSCLPMVRECLRSGDLSMQNFVDTAIASGLVRAKEVSSADAALFRNVNTPGDVD